MNYYFTTLTLSGGIDCILKEVEPYFKSCDQCLAVFEFHSSGDKHLHALHTDKTKKTSNVTDKFTRIYRKVNVEPIKGVSIVVKKAIEKIGLFHYLTKDIPEGKDPWIIRGWKYTWIQSQCKDNLKKMPKKMLQKNDRWVTQREVTSLMLEYAKRTGRVMDCKITFSQVFADMCEDGYQFDSIKLAPVYVQVLARTGDLRAAQSYCMNQLAFLE